MSCGTISMTCRVITSNRRKLEMRSRGSRPRSCKHVSRFSRCSRKSPKPVFSAAEPHILVAHNLTPSDTATMNRELVLGIATDLGSRTSHTAIIARSLNIPAVVGLHDATEKLESGQHVVLDGYTGV